MKAALSPHLRDEQMARALLHPREMAPEEAEHLEVCAQCRKALADLDADLKTLGETARESVPAPPAPIAVPLSPLRPARPWRPLFRPALAAVACALLVLVLWQTGPRGPEQGGEAVVGEYWPAQDEQVLADVQTLVSDDLPPLVEDIAGNSVFVLDGDFAEFLEYVCPSDEGIPLSTQTQRKGVFTC